MHYHIFANIENDPPEALTKRLQHYLLQENYQIKHHQENYTLFSRKTSSWFYLALPMENDSSIRVDWGASGLQEKYSLNLTLEIDAEFLSTEEELYWNAFVKGLEELIRNRTVSSTEHREIKEKYYQQHPYLKKNQLPKLPVLLLLILLFLITSVLIHFTKLGTYR